MTTFQFAFDDRYRPLLMAFTATPARAWVEVDDGWLQVQFGIWSLDTPLSNVTDGEVTGPHRPIKAIGVRTSLSDRGLTFGSNARRMACLSFAQPVRVRPVDVVGHPSLSVSVADPEGLVAAVLGGKRS